MCKIMIFTNTAKMNKAQVESVIKHSSKAFNQNDGFGYSVINKDTNKMFTERFLKPQDVRKNLGKNTDSVKSLFCKPLDSNSEGLRPEKTIGAMILHGRISTNHRSLTNTHPINKHGWSLIHNGVVEDSGPKYDMITSNDTEHCLERLVQGIDSIERHISGYYALGAIDPDNRLHVVKDSIASLYCSYIPTLDTYIFATTEDLIESTCKLLKMKYDSITSVNDNIYLIFDSLGDLKHNQSIEPKGRSEYTDSLSYLSLERELDYDSKHNQNLNAFFEEIENYSDSTYTFLHNQSREKISRNAFLELSLEAMIDEYTVIRTDGTICSPFDYEREELYVG